MDGPFQAKRKGLSVSFSDAEAAAIRSVAEQMLDAMDPATLDEPQFRRLFPPAYEADPVLQDEFLRMTHDDLLARKRNAARAVLASVDAGRSKRGTFSAELDEETAHAWLTVVNDARLVLGTTLGISEDSDPQLGQDPQMNLYLYLSSLQWQLVDALSHASGFGPADTGMA
jgi:hypothetical protein